MGSINQNRSLHELFGWGILVGKKLKKSIPNPMKNW
jgi:hypothetical protein